MSNAKQQLPKGATGIHGLDEITGGGLPRGRPTLVCGGAGCGKTLLAMELLVRGATELGEPGVFIAFEESAEELGQNVRSLGFDLDDLAARDLLSIDYVHVERGEIEETGEYDLEGLEGIAVLPITSLGLRHGVSPERISSGVARLAQEARDRAASQARAQESERKQRELQRKRALLEAQIQALRAELEAAEDEGTQKAAETESRESGLTEDRVRMARCRGVDQPGAGAQPLRILSERDRT